MSFNRENVIWQSPDGTWNRGFFQVVAGGSDDGEYDPEWDVEYGDGFDWVSTGHRTEDSARRSWDGANPGGTTVYLYVNECAEDIASFELEAAIAQRAGAPGGGPRKQVPVSLLARNAALLRTGDAFKKVSGYSTWVPEDGPALEKELSARLRTATPTERREAAEEFAQEAGRLGDALTKRMARPRDRWHSYRPLALEDEKAVRSVITALVADATSMTTSSTPVLTTAPQRAKTTARSTAGSFAPKGQSAPEATLPPSH